MSHMANTGDALSPKKQTVRRSIDGAFLSESEYFLSLSEKAYESGILTDSDLLRIQSELFELLAYGADKLTGGKSCSVSEKTAVSLTRSVLFTVGVRLKREGIPDRAALLLRDVPIRTLYDEAMDTDIRRMMSEARLLQRRILEKPFVTPNVFYMSTVRDGIDGFFKLYKPRFGAHEIHITADYPLLCGRPELVGIEFIVKYLRGIKAENELLTAFSPKSVHALLSKALGDYAESPVNLCEPVLATSLGIILSGRNPTRLDLTLGERDAFCERIRTSPKGELSCALDGALTRLGEMLSLSARTEGYMRRSLGKLSSALKAACDGGVSESIVPVMK